MTMANDVTIDSKDLDRLLAKFSNNLDKISEQVVDDLAQLAYKKMKENYAKADFQPGNIESTDITLESDANERRVIMKGPQAVYTEFGTGTQGALHPHPKKTEFGLNQYNSGKTIRAAKKDIITPDFEHIPSGTLYWTYKDAYGEIHYTQGIPAQKIVYNAGKTVLRKMNSIIKKRMEEQFKQ